MAGGVAHVGGTASPAAAIATALALFLEDEMPHAAPARPWRAAALPDDRGSGRPWVTGSDAWRWAERPR